MFIPAVLADSTGVTGDSTLAAITPAAAITDSGGGVDPGDNIIAVIAVEHASAKAAVAQLAAKMNTNRTCVSAMRDNVVELGVKVNQLIALMKRRGDRFVPARLTNAAGGTADGTAAAMSAAAAITDNGGGTDPGDNIIAAITADDTFKHAVSQLAAKLNSQTTALGLIKNAVASLGARVNAIIARERHTATPAVFTDSSGGTASLTLAAVTIHTAITDSSGGVDPANDTIAAITGDDTAKHAVKQLSTKMNTHRTALLAARDDIGDLVDKVNLLIANFRAVHAA